MNRIRVAMLEDDASFRAAALELMTDAADMVCSAVAATLREGMALLQKEPLDVLIVDLGLPDGSGIDVIRAARICWPNCEVIVTTTFGDEENVLAAIEAGASGYLVKDAMQASLVEEIRSVRAGASPLSPMIARQLLRRLQLPLKSDNEPLIDTVLSTREVQVLQRMALGYTMPETAEFLGVAATTVQTFARRIYRKLGVDSKVGAIDAGYRRGLLRRQE